jgi:hypothetical protein
VTGSSGVVRKFRRKRKFLFYIGRSAAHFRRLRTDLGIGFPDFLQRLYRELGWLNGLQQVYPSSSNKEEFRLLGYSAVEIQQTFRWNVLPLSSCSKNKPRAKAE